MNPLSDEVLIEKSNAGDLDAFKILLTRYEGKVAGVIRSMLGPIAEAEDVGQEVFIRFYESLNKFRGDAHVGTYLVRIAINLCLNMIKKRKRNFLRFAPLEEGYSTSSRDDMMDLKELLVYEFGRLEPDFRSVATLRLVEGYSTAETASILDIPIGTVLSRLARAQQKLRSALSKKLKP